MKRNLWQSSSLEDDRYAIMEDTRVQPETVRHILWLTTCCVSISTTMMLIHVDNIMHPFTLLLLHTILAFALRTILNCTPSRTSKGSRWNLDEPSGHASTLWLCTAAVPTVLTWILTYAALRITNNPLVVLMIISVHYRHISSEHGFFEQQQQTRDLVALLIQVIAIPLILRYDYRLTPGSLAVLLVLFIVSNIARFTQEQLSQWNSKQPRLLIYIITALLCALLACVESWQHGVMFRRSPSSILLVTNVMSSATYMAIGDDLGTPLQYESRQTRSASLNRFTPPVLVGVVAVVYHCLGRDSMLPLQQVVAYLLAVLCAGDRSPKTAFAQSNETNQLIELDLDRLKDDGGSDSSSITGMLKDGEDIVVQPNRSSLLGSLSSAGIILLATSSWIILVSQSIGIVPSMLKPAPAAQLGSPSIVGESNLLDIVVSYYAESVEEMAKNIASITRLETTRIYHPRVYIYNKGDRQNADIQEQVAAFVPYLNETITVDDLPNHGREGETYLSHIIRRWDELAPHTIFIQASMHEPEWSIRHLNSYFNSHTGFLSLSYSSNFCRDCSTCFDLAGWQPEAGAIEEIYQMAYKNETQCQNIPLTYKGQFVASGKRIRGGGQEMYRKLQAQLTNDNGKLGTDINYGFLLERMWGVVMQCADERVADRCPSLFSNSFGRLGSVSDCQCLDTLPPSDHMGSAQNGAVES